MEINGKNVTDENILEWIVFAYREGKSVSTIVDMVAAVSKAFDKSNLYCRNSKHISDNEHLANIAAKIASIR